MLIGEISYMEFEFVCGVAFKNDYEEAKANCDLLKGFDEWPSYKMISEKTGIPLRKVMKICHKIIQQDRHSKLRKST